MSGITNPAEEYFKDGLWGWVTDQWKKLVATAGGALHIQFAGQEADVEVTQTAAADLTPGVCGWDGSAWRKLPMVWGYSEALSEEVVGTASGGGDAQALSTVVAPGYVHVLEMIHTEHNAGVAKDITAFIQNSGAGITILPKQALASGLALTWVGPVTLGAGDKVGAYLYAPGDGKVVRLRVWGYKMKIAE